MSTILYKDQSPVLIDVEKLPLKLQILFVADGLKNIPSQYRSPWLDAQERKRRGNKRDFICNCLGTPLGAADVPFDPSMLEEIKEKNICEPEFEGELIFGFDVDGTIDEESPSFYLGGQKRLQWWGELPFDRPNQRHNYVIGVDPSYGLGSANSTAIIYDCNLREQVGSWADSSTKSEDFADTIVALAYWIGGIRNPFLVWESNGGCGKTFGNRVIWNGYYNCYTQRVEDSKTRKKTKKWGWRSNVPAKEALLGDLGVALSSGLAQDDTYMSMVIHEKELVDELSDCVFKEKGVGIVQASRADLSTGASDRHGDRVIAAGLCVLGAKEQEKGETEDVTRIPYGSFRYYQKEHEKEEKKKQKNVRHYWY